ncbi:SoxW family protein [Rhabdochromatium marinum]|uniref:thioredoxin family protein n=1 Tax=Rhabdochromatium marinum TaxID=48729 RepID=UPI001904C105|nr:thioredoxin [Rhabdochromatium marinum]
MRRARASVPALAVWLLGFGLALVALTGVAAESDAFFNQTFGDFTEELETARAEGKQGLLLMFEMDECPFCHRMKATVLNQPEVQAFFGEHFLVFPVDIEGDLEVVDFDGQTTTQKDFALKQFRVRATPVFAFFDLDGQLVARYTGATRDADEFMQLGHYVTEGAYETTSFTQYKNSQPTD